MINKWNFHAIIFLFFAVMTNSGKIFAEVRLGPSLFWEENGIPGISVYNNGATGIELLKPEKLASLGYKLKEKNGLKEIWQFKNENSEGTFTILKRGSTQFDYVSVESKSPRGHKMADLAVFGDGNILSRRTLCKDQECFVVSKSICDKLDRTMGQQHPEMARQCQQLSSYLVDQMKLALESGTIAADFKADSAKLSSLGIVGGERRVVKPDSLGASAKSIFALSFECQNMRLYNGPQSQGTQSSAAGRSQ